MQLPSGGQVHLHETITEGNGSVTRLRYVTDGFAPDDMMPDTALEDLTFLCRSKALPNLTAPVEGQTVIISLADRVAPFGVMDGSVAQIFEVFTIRDSICIWEAF
ncbi:DUF6497 family protein [Roseovarius sp. M141]|uniref:DUF6497 family protein n=1 Tax=Roseovarius sp. M141 TaxID=2583806 RepID=UPI00338CD9C5|nr:hypothetical protein [Roseovarius sp. M141]